MVPQLSVRYRFSGDDDDSNASGASGHSGEHPAAERERLPYAVELWDDAFEAVERVLALTATSGTAYAASYAAMRDFPDRNIVLRLSGRTLARWITRRH